MSLNPTSPQPPLMLSPWLYGDSNSIFYSNQNPLGIWPNKYVKSVLNETGLGVKCMTDTPLGYLFFKMNFNLILVFSLQYYGIVD